VQVSVPSGQPVSFFLHLSFMSLCSALLCVSLFSNENNVFSFFYFLSLLDYLNYLSTFLYFFFLSFFFVSFSVFICLTCVVEQTITFFVILLGKKGPVTKIENIKTDTTKILRPTHFGE
jgi:hypothetical protein